MACLGRARLDPHDRQPQGIRHCTVPLRWLAGRHQGCSGRLTSGIIFTVLRRARIRFGHPLRHHAARKCLAAALLSGRPTLSLAAVCADAPAAMVNAFLVWRLDRGPVTGTGRR
jgi:hypothetical protein